MASVRPPARQCNPTGSLLSTTTFVPTQAISRKADIRSDCPVGRYFSHA
jgi:hypothetical protein